MTRNKILAGLIGATSVIVAAIGIRRYRSTPSEQTRAAWLPPIRRVSWRGTWRAVTTLMDDMNTHNTGVLAAGIAYYASLAFFPTFAASLAIASIVISPEQTATVIAHINEYLPKDIAGLVSVQLETQSGKYGGNYAVAIIAIAISLFGAAGAIENTLRSLNVVYGVKETRNIVKLRLLSLFILLCTIGLGLIVATLLIVDEYLIKWGIPTAFVETIELVRWPLLFVVVSLAFASLYRYGPNRPTAKWRWASWGAMLATLGWMVVTVGFFAFTRYFPSFSASYTLFAGIIVLMMWFNFSAMALLIGGQINARIESRDYSKFS